MAGIRSEREPMSPAEQASRERRIARAYVHGVELKDMERMFGIRHQTIVELIKARFPHIPLRGKPSRARRAS